MRKLAKIRARDRQGGVKPGSVDQWICKLLTMYQEESRLSLLGATQICVVTDASHHSSQDWLISLVYDPFSTNGAFATAQYVSSSKVVRIGEFELTDEAERVAARRDHERLSSLRFLQGLSSQCEKISNLSLTDFSPEPVLLQALSPLPPSKDLYFKAFQRLYRVRLLGYFDAKG